jgi:hypothetical protein
MTRDATQEAPADVRARKVEEQMTDDERFLLLISVAGSSTVAPSHEVSMCGRRWAFGRQRLRAR